MVQSHSNHTPQTPKQYSQCDNFGVVTYEHVSYKLQHLDVHSVERCSVLKLLT